MKITFEDNNFTVTIDSRREDEDIHEVAELLKAGLLALTFHPESVKSVFAEED